MKSFTDHPHIAAADGTVVGSVLSSDDGAISSGIAIAPTEGVDGLIAGGETINGTLQSATADVESPAGLQRKGLRVSFPEFEVVSGYMDPPRPWNDVSQCSTDELIASYLNSCDKVGVKPNARLLSQLQVITNFDDRNETLTLKNENLDSRHCETLEEVFRRVQFRTIDLEATKLEEEGAVTIFDMIEYYESCMKLNISYSKNLGQRGWQACSRMIRKTPCLENLEARGAVLSDFVMPILGRSLRVSSSLTSLHLEFSVTSGRPLQVLVAALKVNETLKELYLADNKLLPSDGIQLGSLLRYNRTLHLLDLRNNHLQDTGFLHICEGIWEQTNGCGLNTLIMWNNQLSYQAMNHLSKALLTSASLETINLGHNNLTNEGMHRLKESLLKNKTLLRIGLQAAKITCEGAVALAEFIAESMKLVRLDLRENEIKTGGLMALSLALKVSQSVTRIDIDKGPKKESGVKDYAEQQKRLLNDITTYMQRNRMLARQREEEEIALETERLSSVKPDGQLENDPEERESAEETFAEDDSDRAEVRTPEDVVVAVDSQKEVVFTCGESSPRHRMSLTLELKTRCETLESPDFIPESEMPPADLPSADAVAAPTSAGARSTKRKVILDVPPSPMVSSQGRTVLVPVLAGPLSPSFDEESPLNGAEKSEDFALDSTFHSGAQDEPLSSPASKAGESPSKADESLGFWYLSNESPPSSLGSNSSNSSFEDNFSPVSLNVDSRLSHLEDSLTRTQKKKSSLKMMRHKHRFQVSKATLSYKSAGRRGSGGAHKTPHVTTEHSRNEEAISPSLVKSLTAFQSTFTVPLDDSAVNSENSKLVHEGLSGIDSYSLRENDSIKHTVDNLRPVENQNVHEDGGLQKNSPGPVATETVSLHENYISPADSVTKKAETEESVGESVKEIQGLSPSVDKQIISVASDDITAESNRTSSSNSVATESYQIEDQMNEVYKTGVGSCSTQDSTASAGQDADVGGRNESQEPCKGSDLAEKSSHIPNGFALNLLEHEADMETFGDEVNKLGMRKAPSNSSGNLA